MSIDISKHTSLPWVKDYGLTKGHIKSIGANKMNRTPTVCTYSKLPFSISENEAEANAAFICLAVNNHDKLVEALKEANAALNKIIDTGKKENNHVNFFLFDSWCNDIHSANENAKQLLQSIEKENEL